VSVQSYLNNAIRLAEIGEYETAMLLICSCIDATAAREFKINRVGTRINKFVRDNYDIVTSIGFGGAVYAAPGGLLQVLDPAKPNTIKPLEKVIYELIRCELVHGAGLPERIRFDTQQRYGEFESWFCLPVNFVLSLFLCVVMSPSNSDLRFDDQLELKVLDRHFHLNSCAGSKAFVLSVLKRPTV
jgi:hypothetical protein